MIRTRLTAFSLSVTTLSIYSRIISLFSLCVISGVLQAEENNSYKLGVFPQLSVVHVQNKYAPVAAAMSELINKRVKLTTASSMHKFHRRLDKESFDIALIPPLAIIPIVDEKGYIPLARSASRAASIVVNKNSNINKTNDLTHKTVGLPAGTPVNIILRQSLKDLGFSVGKNINYKDYNNVQSCLHKLILNAVDACGTASGAGLKMFEKNKSVKLRKIMTTEKFPHMLFVTHPNFPVDERKVLSRAILGGDSSEQGKKLLNAIGSGSRYVPYKSADYDQMRKYRSHWLDHAKNSL